MLCLFLITVLILTLSSCLTIATQEKKGYGLQTYIIHIEKPENTTLTSLEDHESFYKSFLINSISTITDDYHDKFVYSYHHVVSGFAARLTQEEVKIMEKKPGFLFSQPDLKFQAQTTYTPTFLGLNPQRGFWKHSNYGKGVIIGIVDTGAFAEHPSFGDEGMPPPPPKWKGKCEFKACNKKLIGGRSFLSGVNVKSPTDSLGHGTPVASAAAGAPIPGANMLANANGTAIGMAPLAHLAIYKVCEDQNCNTSDILKGIDTAVEDGVDVINLSLGLRVFLSNFYDNPLDVATFRAMQHGILVNAAAGNSGPGHGTTADPAPWYVSIGASTTDRSFRVTVVLKNGEMFQGESLYRPKDFNSHFFPLIFPGANGDPNATYCNGSFTGINIKGKIVICEADSPGDNSQKSTLVNRTGGAGMILINPKEYGFSLLADADDFVLPASHISYEDGLKVKAYIKSSKRPMAKFEFRGTVFGQTPTPTVASFSSRGPSKPSPGILKPDLIAPGLNILAAYPFGKESRYAFRIVSGTSIAAPHVAGMAALLKRSHPDWSPSAIRSAMMTTAYVDDIHGKPILDYMHLKADAFTMGSGQVDPSRANDPGLIYDITTEDYISYLCGLGYTDQQVQIFTLTKNTCASVKSMKEGDLNYPSITVRFEKGFAPTQTFERTVTNVGKAKTRYTVHVVNPEGVQVRVQPSVLHFSHVGEKKTFTVNLSRTPNTSVGSEHSEGSFKWVSSTFEYDVRSPIAVIFKTPWSS